MKKLLIIKFDWLQLSKKVIVKQSLKIILTNKS